MKTLRTPDERFADLVGYDFAPHYGQVDDLDGGRCCRMRSAPLLVCLDRSPVPRRAGR